jgi:hypothetical protein
MSTPDLTGAAWRKSSRSDGNGGNCVEVATNLTNTVAVRDTKDNGTGPVLGFSPGSWSAFTRGVKAGEFDL